MKNKMYYLGILACLITTCGCILKVMHWPLANILIFIGLITLSLIFLPLATADIVKDEREKIPGIFYIIVCIVMAVNFIGALFKIMHWPGAGILLLIGTPLPFVILLPAYLRVNRVVKEINYKNLLAVMFFFAYFAVITSLLSIRISKNVIECFITSGNNISEKVTALKENKQLVSDYSGINNPVNIAADKLCEKISKVRQMMLSNIHQNTSSGKKHTVYTDVKPQIDINYLADLKREINNFRNTVQNHYGSDSRISKYAEETLALYLDPSEQITWEDTWLQKNIIASAIESLNMLELKVRLIAMES